MCIVVLLHIISHIETLFPHSLQQLMSIQQLVFHVFCPHSLPDHVLKPYNSRNHIDLNIHKAAYNDMLYFFLFTFVHRAKKLLVRTTSVGSYLIIFPCANRIGPYKTALSGSATVCKSVKMRQDVWLSCGVIC